MSEILFGMENKIAYMLHSIPGVGNKTLFKLYEYFGSGAEIIDASEKELRNILTKRQYNALLSKKKAWDVEAEYEDLYNRGIDFYYYSSDGYPNRLKNIPDPPFGLYCIGKLPDEDIPSVSIIGARVSSEYGKYAANVFGDGLAELGIQIISGMARGIDGIGQLAAINAGGESYGVLGSGVDVCYPEENRFLYEKLICRGGIISEYYPGTQPKPHYFPPRNRIISGLSDAVLVIEARQKSGTLITVDMALEQGREVFAVPGRVNDGLSSGCNSLIRQGASIATSPEDIAEYLRGCAKTFTEKQIREKAFVSNENEVIEIKTPVANSGKQSEIKTPVASVMEQSETKTIEGKRYFADEDGGYSVDNQTGGYAGSWRKLSDAQSVVLKQLDMYPGTTTKIYEKIMSKGFEMSISEVMNVLVELCVLGIVGQNSGGFFIKG